MTDTKKPTTTVAQDVAAFRAIADGAHAATETPAEVLADMKDRYSGDAYLMRWHDRLERSLAAGRVAPTAWMLLGPDSGEGTRWLGFTSDQEHANCHRTEGTEVVPLYTAPPAEPDKSSGIAPIIDMALIVEALEQSDPKAAGYPEPRSRHARALEVARQLLATPPASAPEVTDAMVELALNTWFRNGISNLSVSDYEKAKSENARSIPCDRTEQARRCHRRGGGRG